MVSALAVVLSLMVLVTMIVRRLLPGQLLGRGETPIVRILGSGYLGPRKSISVVSVAGEVLIIGTTATHLVPLGQVKDPEQAERFVSPRRRIRKPLPSDDPTLSPRKLDWLGRAFKLFEDEGVWRVSAYPPSQEEVAPAPKAAPRRLGIGGRKSRPNVRMPRRISETTDKRHPQGLEDEP